MGWCRNPHHQGTSTHIPIRSARRHYTLRSEEPHIHAAPVGEPGGIVVGLETPDPRTSHGCITAVPDDQNTVDTLTESELAAIVADPSAFYVNVHNTPFPAGAIRGQLG